MLWVLIRSASIHKNICCGYSLEAPHQGASNEYPQHMFLWGYKKNYPRIITKYATLTIPPFFLFLHKTGVVDTHL